MILIRSAGTRDREAVWKIIRSVIESGDTYVYPPDSPKSEMLDYWFSPEKYTYVAELGGRIVATFWLKPNQPGLGSHVANAAYMVAPSEAGKGIGTQIALWSLDEARRLGFKAMQFNFVVKSNASAIALWQKVGFRIIGEIPGAFRHSQIGLTNALIMYREL